MKKFDVTKDHKRIKKQIKEREKKIDDIVNLMLKTNKIHNIDNLQKFIKDQKERLEEISHEMFAINF